MHLRPAGPADLALLLYWNTKPHVAAATGDDGAFEWEAELPRHPDWRELLIAEIDSRPVGIMQIIDPAREETHYWGKVEPDLRAIDIWIGEETDLGRGYGSQMMRLALDRCFADAAVRAVLVDPLAANVRAHRFYERLGFRPVERRVFGSDDCLVYRLERGVWHTARGRSAANTKDHPMRFYTIAAAEIPRYPVLWLTFDDGFAGEVDFSSTIATGGIFAFLADPAAFATVRIGEWGRSLLWLDPEGEKVDFCADALRFQAEEQVVRQRAAHYGSQKSPSE